MNFLGVFEMLQVVGLFKQILIILNFFRNLLLLELNQILRYYDCCFLLTLPFLCLQAGWLNLVHINNL